MSDKGFRFRRIGIVLIAWAVLVAFDQWTKHIAYGYLPENGPVSLINNILELLYVENTGAAFGMLKGANYVFYILAIGITLIILYVQYMIPDDRKYRALSIALSFVTAGADGNLIDRVTRGFVVDFIYFMPIDFPVFNVADIYVTCSCAALVVLIAFIYKDSDFEFLNFNRK